MSQRAQGPAASSTDGNQKRAKTESNCSTDVELEVALIELDVLF